MKIEIEYKGSYAVCKVDGRYFMDCDSLTKALTLDAFRTIEQHFYRENGFCNPIPITEEWLAKQGFKREYDCICEYTYYIREIDGYFVEVKIGCSNMGDDYVNCHIDNCDRNSVASADIQYVHQLQNLLNIMNIKFDIKL